MILLVILRQLHFVLDGDCLEQSFLRLPSVGMDGSCATVRFGAQTGKALGLCGSYEARQNKNMVSLARLHIDEENSGKGGIYII